MRVNLIRLAFAISILYILRMSYNIDASIIMSPDDPNSLTSPCSIHRQHKTHMGFSNLTVCAISGNDVGLTFKQKASAKVGYCMHR